MAQDSGLKVGKDSITRKANVLLCLTERIGIDTILPHLVSDGDLNIRVVRRQNRENVADDDHTPFPNVEVHQGKRFAIWEEECALLAQEAHQHAKWADVLFVEMDPDTISAMLAGLAYDTILSILRCWDTSKKVILLPELSVDEWRSPITNRQMAEIQGNWSWIQVLRPALWDVKDDGSTYMDHKVDLHWDWEGPEELIRAIQTEVKKITCSPQGNSPPHSVDTIQPYGDSSPKQLHRPKRTPTRPTSKLPPEIWTLVFEFLGDWEYATALGIYTKLPVPNEWLPYIPPTPLSPRYLEYILLTSPPSTIRATLDKNSTSTLSPLAVKLIFKFSLTHTLSHLATHHKDIFWTSFGLALIPHKASIIYNNPTILEWWRTEPAILRKEYGPEAVDGASRAGHLDVLEWWANSGLEMRYTEKALESASAKGHLHILEWWKQTSRAREQAHHLYQQTLHHHHTTPNHASPPLPLLPLKVGKSILTSSQSGRARVLHWWHASGIPYSHEESVARIASTHGHVSVLNAWYDIKGNKMIFDHQVLVGATKNGHRGVLEWWKRHAGAGAVGGGEGGAGAGLRVEYKTCDIEEAMEDCLGGSGQAEREVRDWWERNGLNLGVGTSEWMKVKCLGD